MSKIQDQIKLLQVSQKKLDYVDYLLDLVKNDKKCIDFKDVQQEIVSQIEPFLLSLKETIEKQVTNSQKEEVQTKSEGPFANEAPPAQAQQPQAPKPKSKVESAMSINDQMNFAMTNRHLGGKRVQVLSKESDNVFGSVVGLEAPFILVKTDVGHTIKVPLNELTLVAG